MGESLEASFLECTSFAQIVRGVAGRRGDKARIAAALGLDPAAVSRADSLSEHSAARVARVLGPGWEVDVARSTELLRTLVADAANSSESGGEQARSRAATQRAEEAWVRMSESDRRSFLRGVEGGSTRALAELGDRILEAYQAKGLTRTAFARAIGVKPNSVWRYEQGESRPRPDTLARIADVTGRSLEWLLVGERRERVDSAAPPSAYDLVRRMDARELRAFRAWVLAWTDQGPDAA